jgi:hypothetical protein
MKILLDSKVTINDNRIDRKHKLSLSGSVEVIQCLLNSFTHILLTFSYPNSRIKVFLVGLVLAVRIPDLGRYVIFLGEHVVPYSSTVCVLQVSVKIDFDNTISDSFSVLFLGAAATTVEYEEAIIS